MSNSDDSGQGPADSPPIPKWLKGYTELGRAKREAEETAVMVMAFFEEVRQSFDREQAFELTRAYLECVVMARYGYPAGD